MKIPPPEICCVERLSGRLLEKGQEYHMILDVKDNGTPSLTTYKRIVIQTRN